MVHASAPPFILAQLPPDLQHVLLTCVQIAARQDVQLWLVGGVVRDLLQQRGPTRDLDLAYAGDAPQLCGALAAALGATLLAEHSAFGTATLTVPMPNNAPPLLLDLARTRREHYPQPASLPHVTPTDIGTDLERRDFSVNAMAVPLILTDLNPPTLGLGHCLTPMAVLPISTPAACACCMPTACAMTRPAYYAAYALRCGWICTLHRIHWRRSATCWRRATCSSFRPNECGMNFALHWKNLIRQAALPSPIS